MDSSYEYLEVNGNLHGPPGKVKRTASPDIELVHATLPVGNPCIHQGLHFLHVGEAVLYVAVSVSRVWTPSTEAQTYRARHMSSKGCMCLVRSHVEQTLRLSKATGDIMAGLVDFAVV